MRSAEGSGHAPALLIIPDGHFATVCPPVPRIFSFTSAVELICLRDPSPGIRLRASASSTGSVRIQLQDDPVPGDDMGKLLDTTARRVFSADDLFSQQLARYEPLEQKDLEEHQHLLTTSTKPSRQSRWFRAFACVLALVIGLGLGLFLYLSPPWPEREVPRDSSLLGPPVPIPCHSHNDYWRPRPVFSALDSGCVGIEADVWLRGSELYVGHNTWSLRDYRTLRSLYINPLVELLERRNAGRKDDSEPRGVFESNPAQTLVLLIDLKSTAAGTWDEVVRQLQPLRERGWLSHLANGSVHYRPITVVGTGRTDFDRLVSNTTYRDYFIDAPIGELEGAGYNATNSYYASKSFKKAIGTAWFGELSEGQLRKLRQQVADAHSQGLKVRYWGAPSWPASVRRHIWSILVREGVDIINVDDLQDAEREWRIRGWPTLGKGATIGA